MDFEKVFHKFPAAYTSADIDLIKSAYVMAEEAHRGQKRASGVPYISHCVGVANILLDIEVAPSLVVAGLLHDVVLDTAVTLDQIREKFGDTIAKFVEDLTMITSLPQVSRGDQHPEEITGPLLPDLATDSRKADYVMETLRKLLLAIGSDFRVIIVKLADRLHNMRTLKDMPPERQKRIAEDTLEIYAPLANRLGIWQIKWELEDLAFRYVNPEEYNKIAEKLATQRIKRQEEINAIIANLTSLLEKSEVKAVITGRPKHIYSIYRKMQRKDGNFDAIRDLRAVRILVDDVETCYKVLGIMHMHFTYIPGEFDDYIAAKKPNNYQSLHTTVIYKDGKPLEIQIRTHEMHRNAEFGVAAHWRYKEKSGLISDDYEQKVSLIRNLLSWSQEVEEDSDETGVLPADLFGDRVYVITPKGDVIDLPSGSTPIDFAYMVHTNVGHRCRGAKVNGKLVPLDYQLQTGDKIEILTANRGGPSRDWLNPSLGLVKSARTRSKIKQWFKQQDREQNLEHGKLLIEKEFKRLGIGQIDLLEFLDYFHVRTLDDLYVGIGCGDIPIGRLVNRIAETQHAPETETIELVPTIPSKAKPGDTVIVMGLKGLATTMARCCNPMPGDEIIGYITRGRGATIHRSDCPNVLRVIDKERLVKVDWGTEEKTFPIPLQIKAYDRQGLMTDISAIISSEPVRLIDLSLNNRQNLVVINLVLEISGISQLSRLLARLENLPNVIQAIRVRPG
ncbi:MAG: bifunctional (p)ppGpp synthetase/guanosine-3',5'-bis(diphosphate) 3'-pyrophosphohydrolase [Chloroflexi bacterium]|jgi:GTP pyrophosphokinase|nr:bifunctional (p)ppGpp synthetase/guanosine-3',5'-bis(diphosphate) 3'-pyrophosphohydrolase [Anaerolineaceae bacterium]NLI43884.1 bifunctional (p)ppGpp synthetase/guanosine-3',5'-bis(diphosphate) 3'-pyrophosphohydrolase [Chloroflexota bacterium]HOE35742.1 bifunctional (p)ppGpp synthetase/guanosine-3',5'-bis(diphosphate) 3'-pyrophosphohydrolase [Anaerolineaceae bacterium]HOT24977.1 bifunctional (p)ppGpp synthetase/guanosine-3',5'-bis(diphosphate) 3'-pyrophosphohydrolase [Anaerolineaceae bacteriu